ncbi:MAG: hypothetical protein ACRCTJ_03115 [Brevinema sp.]
MKTNISLLSFFFLFVIVNYAQNTTDSLYSVQVSFIKQNYAGNEAIDACVKIFNKSNSPITFSLADDFLSHQSITFELRTSQNIIIPIKNNLQALIKLKASDPSQYREITLLQGESFSKIFNIRDFYDLSEAKTYYIEALFFPDPDNHSTPYRSSFASFSQSVPSVVQEAILKETLIQTAKFKELSRLLPNEIIMSFFNSQMEKNWELFLLHIDPERLIYSFPNFAKQYDQATSGVFKLEIIDQFKRFFSTHWNIPLTSYKITRTIIEDDSATVTVDAIESIRFTNRRLRYTFTLYRTGQNSWLIENYLVLSLN